MFNVATDTAVLLFTRTSAAEASIKNFLQRKCYKQNKIVAQKLIERAEQSIRATRLPYFIITEQQQQGKTFGQRLSNAIESVLARGFDKVIVIGNDCLALTNGLIEKAASELSQHKVVVGATDKGGVYLLGINKGAFCKKELEKIRWQTDNVFTDISAIAHHNKHTTSFLPVYSDVNNYVDLAKEIRFLSKRDYFASIIYSIIASLNNAIKVFFTFTYQSPVLRYTGLRGPPCIN